jgi:cytochrome P450
MPAPIEPPFDLFSPRFKADPFPTFTAMRDGAPVYRHVAPNGGVMWYITRYEDVLEVLKDERFVKNIRNALPPAAWDGLPHTDPVLQLINQNMLFADPPDHTRLRALVGQAFTPRRIEALAARVQALTDAILDAVAPLGAMDLIGTLAFPLPLAVIAELLGLPERDQPKLRHWSEAIIAAGSHGISYGERRRRIRALVDYVQIICQGRQSEPRDDLISALVTAEEQGERLSEAELSSMIVLLIVTGHETTVNLIGNGALALLRHPEQRALLASEPGLWPAAIEELLRFDGPVETSTTRWAREDLIFRGQQIRRGDIVRVVLTSANRDPAQFDDPHKLDVGRDANRHLAFGHGIHYCLGAPLARLEGRITLSALFRRFPDLRLAIAEQELLWRSGVLFRGLKALPLAWTSVNRNGTPD